MTDERPEQIRRQVAQAEIRMSPDRAFVLVTACRDLLAHVDRLEEAAAVRKMTEEEVR